MQNLSCSPNRVKEQPKRNCTGVGAISSMDRTRTHTQRERERESVCVCVCVYTAISNAKSPAWHLASPNLADANISWHHCIGNAKKTIQLNKTLNMAQNTCNVFKKLPTHKIPFGKREFWKWCETETIFAGRPRYVFRLEVQVMCSWNCRQQIETFSGDHSTGALFSAIPPACFYWTNLQWKLQGVKAAIWSCKCVITSGLYYRYKHGNWSHPLWVLTRKNGSTTNRQKLPR